MSSKRRLYPFNAEQTVNILSEFGPLITMFIVNGAFGIEAGTLALMGTTILAMIVMRLVLGRLPIFPIIASGVTVFFGTMTYITGDAMWIQIKVTIFNAMFAGFLFGGLWASRAPMASSSVWAVLGITAVALAAQTPYLLAGWPTNLTASNPLLTNVTCIAALVIGFLLGGLVFKRNFFCHVFEKTFHYTPEGWNKFTFSFAWFFVFTAVLNEVVRQVFVDTEIYPVPLLGEMDGVNIWILFKLAFIMPLSGLYAWYLTTLMHRYRIDAPAQDAHGAAAADHSSCTVASPNPARSTRQAVPPASGSRRWLAIAAIVGFVTVGAGFAYAYKSVIGSKIDEVMAAARAGQADKSASGPNQTR